MTSKGQKLSKPQEELLRELPRTVADSYAPIKKLIALGLASKFEGSGKMGQPKYVLTPDGEEWLKNHPA